MYETMQKSCMVMWKQIPKFLNSLDNYFGNSQTSHFSQIVQNENLLCSLIKLFSGDYSSK